MKNIGTRLATFLIVLLISAEALSTTINLNTIASHDLAVATGISAREAAYIVQYRYLHGAFTSIDDLYEIPQLTRATIEQLRNDAGIVVGGVCDEDQDYCGD